MSALLFGSISTVADTSELQRQAFNQAFEQHGLDWSWDRDEYRSLLDSNGGAGRIAEYATSKGVEVDAAAVHDTKSKIFQQSLSTSAPAPRPGVVESIDAAKTAGWKLGLVTTTSRANIAALLDALAPNVQASDFDVIVDTDDVDESKPDPAAYEYALAQLGEAPGDCVAIEDNVGGVASAVAAGVACAAFPNENTAGHDFSAASAVVERLELSDLQQLTAGA